MPKVLNDITISGQLTVTKNDNALRGINITNTDVGNSAGGFVRFNASSGLVGQIFGGNNSNAFESNGFFYHATLGNANIASATGNVQIMTGGVSTANTKLRVFANGNVCVGTNPADTSYKFSVVGGGTLFQNDTNNAFSTDFQNNSSGTTASVRLNFITDFGSLFKIIAGSVNSASYPNRTYISSGGNGILIGAVGASANIDFATNTAGTAPESIATTGSRMRIFGNGNVAIDTNATDDGVNKLQVNGSIKQTSVINNVLQADATGKLVAANIATINGQSITAGGNVTTYWQRTSNGDGTTRLEEVTSTDHLQLPTKVRMDRGAVIYDPFSGSPRGMLTFHNQNVFLGSRSSAQLVYAGTPPTGVGNISIGELAGSALTSGQTNIIIGHSAGGTITTGSSNILIGFNAQVQQGTSNNLTIGSFIYGNQQSGTRVGIAQSNPQSTLDVNGTVGATQFKLNALNSAPASAGDTGTLGEIRIDDSYIYVCTATNTWKRAALSTW